MDMQLAGQRVVVFGACGGIGGAIATSFLEEGCQVAGFDSSPLSADKDLPSLSMTCGEITNYQAVERFAQALGVTDHVIYCIGVGSGVGGFPFWNLSPSDWQRVLEVNLLGAVHAAHAFAPAMAERRRGSFLFLVSVAAQIGSPTDPPYSAAKAGLINFMQCMARDLAAFDVRVNALSPGMVQTPLNRSVWQAVQSGLPEDQRLDYQSWTDAKIRQISPLGRWQTVQEYGAMAVYLASQHARNITGQTINIDGGQVMHS